MDSVGKKMSLPRGTNNTAIEASNISPRVRRCVVFGNRDVNGMTDTYCEKNFEEPGCVFKFGVFSSDLFWEQNLGMYGNAMFFYVSIQSHIYTFHGLRSQ